MKIFNIGILLSFFLILIQFDSYSIANYCMEREINAIVNDTVVIRLNDFIGDIQWQKTYSLDEESNWIDIIEATQDTIALIIEKRTFIRARVVSALCDPFYSDTVIVNVMDFAEVLTVSVVEVSVYSAVALSNIQNDGGAEVTARGIVWGTHEIPTLENNDGYTFDGSGTGEFTSQLAELAAETQYFIAAYATNSVGTSYGEVLLFETLPVPVYLPNVTTLEVADITFSSALCGGNVTSDGGAEVTARGIVWGTHEIPTLENNDGYTFDGSGTGEFTSQLAELAAETQYFIAAYATNSVGTSYGEVLLFETLPVPVYLPNVTTLEVADITFSSALCGGNVTSDGGAEVTARGIVWGTHEIPTLENNDGYTVDGPGTGEFNSQLDGLAAKTQYFIAAYATNSEGTSYGQQIDFTTDERVINPVYGDGVTDIDGNFYPSVIIGNQEWMAKDLNVTRDANGNAIERHCYGDIPGNCDLYGGLYVWATVMNGAVSSKLNPSGVQGICPTGWHVPSHDEWTELERYICNYLGNSDCEEHFPYDNSTAESFRGTNEANFLKSCLQVNSPLGGDCSTSEHPRWRSNDIQFGTDDYGFSMLPGGHRNTTTTYDAIGLRGYGWSATQRSTNYVWRRAIEAGYGGIHRADRLKAFGFSLRCVKDPLND
jgi:uncharacterized protein (TIGR02145 family)